jgi:hypothetical protein
MYRTAVEALAGKPALVLGEAGPLVVKIDRFSDVTGHAELLLVVGIASPNRGAEEMRSSTSRLPIELP